MTRIVFVYSIGTMTPPLLIVTGKLLNIDVIQECDIKATFVTTA